MKFSREFYVFHELNLEIESFGETHTHKQQHDSGLLLLLFLREAVRSWLWDF